MVPSQFQLYLFKIIIYKYYHGNNMLLNVFLENTIKVNTPPYTRLKFSNSGLASTKLPPGVLSDEKGIKTIRRTQ